VWVGVLFFGFGGCGCGFYSALVWCWLCCGVVVFVWGGGFLFWFFFMGFLGGCVGLCVCLGLFYWVFYVGFFVSEVWGVCFIGWVYCAGLFVLLCVVWGFRELVGFWGFVGWSCVV